MLRRRDWGLVLTGLLCLLSGCDGTPTIDRVLANGPGPVDADAPEKFTTTDSGLKYRILRKGGGERPTANDKVEVNYAGWLDNGRQFDTSYATGRPLTIPLKSVIRGWFEGLQLVTEGGMIELEIPSQLGYGSRGSSPSIPSNATLHFLVELIQVIPPPQPVKPGSADPGAPEEFTTTYSGLKYRILRQGDGKKPSLSSNIKVHYRGWLDNETQFDSSYDRGEPATFALSSLVPGFGEGLSHIGEGGMIELEIPGDLGYGPTGSPPVIPPNATLHFLVELFDVQE